MQWIFVGAGNMASSLIGGLLASGHPADSISVVDPNTEALERAEGQFGIRSAATLQDIMSQIGNSAVGIVLAVKPDIIELACKAVTACLQDNQSATAHQSSPLVISVAAGVRTSSMQHWLPEGVALVRCMPNTPALLGLGATALFANDTCTTEQRTSAEQLLSTAGMTLWVDKESALDTVTAISGSGPAYFFYLIEQMAKAGTEFGLDETAARELAIETAFGAASMAKTRDHLPSTLRENVTSKGGTTAAALQVFNDEGLPALVRKAMQAASDRAVELGDQFAPD